MPHCAQFVTVSGVSVKSYRGSLQLQQESKLVIAPWSPPVNFWTDGLLSDVKAGLVFLDSSVSLLQVSGPPVRVLVSVVQADPPGLKSVCARCYEPLVSVWFADCD